MKQEPSYWQQIDENKIIWSSVKLRQGYFKVSADLRKKLND